MKSNIGLVGILGLGITSSTQVSGQNILPRANDSWVSGNRTDRLIGNIEAWDEDGHVADIIFHNAPNGFSRSGYGVFEWNYEPNGIITNHNIAFQAKDDNGSLSFTNYLNIDITNRPPHAFPQSVESVEGEDTAILLWGTDPDGDSISYSLVNSVRPEHGILNGSGNFFFYTADRNYFGPDMFQFRVYDGHDSSEAFIWVEVLKTDRPFELLSLLRNETNSTITARLQPNRNYVLERSSNLSNWFDIMTNQTAFSTNDFANIYYNFSDTNTSSSYRIRRE